MPFLLGVFLLISTAGAKEFAIIVNAQNPSNVISRMQITDFFLKRVKTWPDGVTQRFFDRTDRSPIRREFLRSVIRKSSRDIEMYWIGQKLYSGQTAPTQVATDNMVEIMVSRFPGGIGYVSKDYEPTRSVKKIIISEP